MKKFLGLFIMMLFFTINSYGADGDLVVNNNLQVNGTLQFSNGSTQTTAWLPAGTIIMYGGSIAPTGWVIADGSAVSRTTYSALFAAIGTTYGAGNGSTTFNLPDFRGVFPKGAGTTNRTAGKDANGNYYSGSLGIYLQDKLQGHKHTLASIPVGNYASYNGSIAGGTNVPYTSIAPGISSPTPDGANGTPRTGQTTEPQSLGVNFIIKY